MKTKEICKNPRLIKNCPIEYTMKIIGGKWKPIVLFRIYIGINRFGTLSRNIQDISKSMLTKQLRELEQDKIINRKIYPEIPPRVEYSLTKKGISLIPILENLKKWGMKNKKPL
jgi:DNA-binding HxlR family transcriptional regulator|tara:strand:+ start:1724 stop:2065 length:342 start_codon:yes stop_codon:yes gene_type:complete